MGTKGAEAWGSVLHGSYIVFSRETLAHYELPDIRRIKKCLVYHDRCPDAEITCSF